MIASLARHEWRRLTRSPMLWILLASFLFLLSYLFLSFLDHFLSTISTANAGNSKPLGVTRAVMTPTFLWAGILGLALLPLFSARIFPEEFQKRSWALLACSPLNGHQIALGKLLGLQLPILLLSIIPLLLAIPLAFGTSLDFGLLLSAWLGLWLTLTAFSSAVLYLSTLSRDPFTATVLSYGLLLLLTVFHVAGSQSTQTGISLYQLSPLIHLSPLLEGRVSSHDLIYFISGGTLFVWLSIRRIGSPTWRSMT